MAEDKIVERRNLPRADEWVSLHEGVFSQFIGQAVLRAHRELGIWPDDILVRMRQATWVAKSVCDAIEDLATRESPQNG